MKDWFVKDLGDGIMAHEPLGRIEQLSLSVYDNSKNRGNMAVFIRHESQGQLHCAVKVYFSPQLAAVAKEFDAQSCERPQREGLSVLVGSQECWRLFSP